MKKHATGFLITAALVFAAAGIRPAFASKNARIQTETSKIYDGPGPQFSIVEEVAKGTIVVVSNLPIQGYYKVRLGDGKLGFVAGDEIAIYPQGGPTMEPVAAASPASKAVARVSKPAPTPSEKSPTSYSGPDLGLQSEGPPLNLVAEPATEPAAGAADAPAAKGEAPFITPTHLNPANPPGGNGTSIFDTALANPTPAPGAVASPIPPIAQPLIRRTPILNQTLPHSKNDVTDRVSMSMGAAPSDDPPLPSQMPNFGDLPAPYAPVPGGKPDVAPPTIKYPPAGTEAPAEAPPATPAPEAPPTPVESPKPYVEPPVIKYPPPGTSDNSDLAPPSLSAPRASSTSARFQPDYREPKPSTFALQFFGGIDPISPADLNHLINQGAPSSMFHAGIETAVKLSEDWIFEFRFERMISTTHSVGSYGFRISGWPVMFGMGYNLLGSANSQLRLSFLFGASLADEVDAEYTAAPSPNTSEIKTAEFVEMLKLDYTIALDRSLGLFFEAGYRYQSGGTDSVTAPLPPGRLPNGVGVFANGSQGFVPVAINLSGPVLSAGLSVLF